MKNPVILHLPLYLPKTGMMVTVGKASSDNTVLRKMAEAGATVFRLNAGQFKKHPDGRYHVRCENSSRPVDEVIQAIRWLEVDFRRPLLTYLDLAGPKLRVEEVRGGKEHPGLGDRVRIYLDTVPPAKRGSEDAGLCSIYVSDAEHQLFPQRGISTKDQISFKDGLLVVDIDERERNEAGHYCEGSVSKVADDFEWLVSEDTGTRGARVGCNPVGYHFRDIITVYDHQVIDWGVDVGIDVFSQSFVCHPIDAFRLRCALAQTFKKKGRPATDALHQTIIGKVETAPAVKPGAAESYAATAFREGPENELARLVGVYDMRKEMDDQLEFRRLAQRFKTLSYFKDPIPALAEAFDGLMVARGDLAVEVEKVNVPNIQRRIAEECRVRSKAVIIATEVLVSMQRGLPSTRAEIGDINTAVFQEADIIMLGGEVASIKGLGFTPDQVVSELREAIVAAEMARRTEDEKRNFESRQLIMEDVLTRNDPNKKNHDDIREKLSMGARVCNAARTKKSPAIFASVSTGATASYIADFSPVQPIIAITNSQSVARRLLLFQGVYPVRIRSEFDHTVESFVDILLDCHSHFFRDGTWLSESVVCPGLLRIDSAERAALKGDDAARPLRPNTLLEVTLPDHPEDPRETEWKYLLSKQSHMRLRKMMMSRYKCREVNQQNTYFTDRGRRLLKKEISLRLRLEESLCEPKERVFFTWKAKNEKSSTEVTKNYFATRPELEYDVTQQYQDWKKRHPGDANFRDFSLKDLPEFWSIVWERSDAYDVTRPKRPSLGTFELIGQLDNVRLSAIMKSGVHLELDCWGPIWPPRDPASDLRDLFKVRYELEVEDRAENSERVDEVIHDLLASLKIPIIYGSSPKMVTALLRSGEFSPKSEGTRIQGIRKSDRSLKRADGHQGSCGSCKNVFGDSLDIASSHSASRPH